MIICFHSNLKAFLCVNRTPELSVCMTNNQYPINTHYKDMQFWINSLWMNRTSLAQTKTKTNSVVYQLRYCTFKA